MPSLLLGGVPVVIEPPILPTIVLAAPSSSTAVVPVAGPKGDTGPSGIVLLDHGVTTPPSGTPVGSVIFQKSA
jgi:hypothetical protein